MGEVEIALVRIMLRAKKGEISNNGTRDHHGGSTTCIKFVAYASATHANAWGWVFGWRRNPSGWPAVWAT